MEHEETKLEELNREIAKNKYKALVASLACVIPLAIMVLANCININSTLYLWSLIFLATVAPFVSFPAIAKLVRLKQEAVVIEVELGSHNKSFKNAAQKARSLDK